MFKEEKFPCSSLSRLAFATDSHHKCLTLPITDIFANLESIPTKDFFGHMNKQLFLQIYLRLGIKPINVPNVIINAMELNNYTLAEYIHHFVEAKKIAFADSKR